jgi:hypothetical protein
MLSKTPVSIGWIAGSLRDGKGRKTAHFDRVGSGTSLALDGDEKVWLYPTGVSLARRNRRVAGLILSLAD